MNQGILLLLSGWMYCCMQVVGYERTTYTSNLVDMPYKTGGAIWQPESNCSTDKRCRCLVFNHSRVADCSGLNIDILPLFQPDITVIYLQGNHIRNFKTKARERDMDETPMFLEMETEENSSPFKGLNKLQYLDLSNNSLEYWSSVYTTDVFKGLKNLKYLNLKQNNAGNEVANASYPVPIADLSSLEILLLDGVDKKGFPNNFSNLRYLESLDISGGIGHGCKLSIIRNDYFANTPYVKNLTMSNCNLEFIERGAFMNLKNLRILNISNNKELTFRVLANVTYDLQFTSIDEFDLSRIHCTYGPGTVIFKDDVINLQNTNLTRIHYDSNRLAMFESGAVSVLPKTMKYAWAADNAFTFGKYILELGNITSWEVFHGSNQHSSHDPTTGSSDCKDWRSPLSSTSGTVTFPKTKNNFLRTVGKSSKIENIGEDLSNFRNVTTNWRIRLPPSLKEVHFSKSSLDYEIGSLQFLPNNITHIEFSHNLLHAWIGPVSNMQKLRYVDFSNNYCTYVSDHFFDEAPNIETLLIQNNLLGFTLYNDVNGKVFERLRHLKVINLSFNRLDRIPKLLFKNQYELQVLNLSFNGLYKMELEFSHMTHLQYVDLSYNQIEDMKKSEWQQIDSIKHGNLTINLNGNRFGCTCETLEFLTWMKTNEEIFENFRKYQCRFSNYTNISFANIENTLVALKKSCDSYIGLIVGTVCVIMLAISLTIAGFVYRYRWKLRYLYYMAKGRYRGYKPVDREDTDGVYEFDAFISYCEQDYRFVKNDLVENLENQSHLHVCLHQRDFMIGQDIAENITQAIHQSRKTVVILSESYLRSYWCMYEFNMARMESIYSRGGNSVLLLVFYENIAPKDLPLSLMDVIESKSYIEYPNDEQGNVVFWDKLADFIKT